MRPGIWTRWALTILVLFVFAISTAGAESDGPVTTVPVKELEDELSGIEKELTDLELQIDTLLEDLVDPKITSLSVFFTSGSLRGRVPASLQIHLDGELLSAREFDQTDRLVLVRGGALEVFSGIMEPVRHDLTLECFLIAGEPQGQIISTGKAAFSFEAIRARANFLEVTLSEDTNQKTNTYNLTARHWTREP